MRRSMAAALLAAAACATAVPQTASQQPARDDERALARAEDERAAALEQPLSAASTPPDCGSCDLVEQICELSRRICAIAGRHFGDEELAARCTSSEQRCRRSRERLPADCPCRTR